jgi:hypothetical protein|tara:strand:- start:236 stop:433 length:198 start_codon:yes stop_codon:yes gene_type:complete
MVRVPAKLKGNSPEAAWHNQLREVILSLMPVGSSNTNYKRTTRGTVREGKGGGSGAAGSGKAVWL